MLPDIRAVIAAVVAAVGLLMISFGLVATFRVAQESRTDSFQADLSKRGRDFLPASSDQRPVLIDTPAEKAVAAEPAAEAPPPVAAPSIETAPTPPAAAIATAPKSEPPVGGPLDQRPAAQPETSREAAAISDDVERAAAAKARKARAARLARERRAAARRAAKARRANETRQQAAPFGGGQFGNFGGTFTTPRQ